MTKNSLFTIAGILLTPAGAGNLSAAVLYSGGNPATVPSPQPPGSGMSWNYYSTSSNWSKPYVGVTIPGGDEWTVTGFEFYEAIRTTADPLSSVMWDVRTTAANLDAPGLVASGTATNVSYVDSGLTMTYVYDYDIYKFTVAFDTPVVLAGGDDYYFSTMLFRGRFADLSEATVFSNGTGRIGVSPDTFTQVWNAQPGYSPASVTYSSSDLAFSVIGTSSVPEPGTTGLLALSGLVLNAIRVRRQRSM
jgi:hypothetical protein